MSKPLQSLFRVCIIGIFVYLFAILRTVVERNWKSSRSTMYQMGKPKIISLWIETNFIGEICNLKHRRMTLRELLQWQSIDLLKRLLSKEKKMVFIKFKVKSWKKFFKTTLEKTVANHNWRKSGEMCTTKNKNITGIFKQKD